MEQLYEFIAQLFGTESWPARWVCGIWSPFHGWLYIISDLMIWAAYFVIPIYIVRYLYKKNVSLPRIFWLFAGFILLCGLTHLMDAIIFYWPAYRLSAFIRFFTGIVSWATVIAIFKIFPSLLEMRTAEDYELEIKQREAAEQQLRKSNLELERYAYVTSHDLQAPLKTMLMSAQILKEDLQGKISEEEQLLLDRIQGGAHHMTELINDLLLYSRVGQERQMKTVNLRNEVEKLVDSLQGEILEQKAKVNVQGEWPTIEAVPSEIKQLFQNLITNAMKFKHPDRHPEVLVRAWEEASYYGFVVVDNGIGIHPKHKDKIFEMFQRLHAQKDYSGTGIGLATCKKIVELYGGSIWMESIPGQSTSMFFTLKKTEAGA